jgi:adenosylmethionine-8-amino-7-oxononanoate aminotransferase
LALLPAHFKKVFFSDDGSTAVEVALKMAIQFFYNQNENRTKILAIDGAYHGDTFGAMSVGQRGYFNRPFEPYFFEVDFLDFPFSDLEAQILEDARQKLKSESYALLIVEPLVQGSAGMRTYSVAFLQELVSLAKAYGTLVVFDEVMTAWGRTGKMFAMNHGDFEPDIVCLSKGLTGGVLPLGITVASQRIYDAFLSEEKTKALLHGHSFTGNALACAAACASIDLFEQEDTWKNIAMIVRENEQIIPSFEQLSAVKEVRNLGTILAVEMKDAQSDYFSNIRDEAYRFFLAEGILLRPLGNVIFINPPYCISKQELNEIYNKMIKFVKKYTHHYES